MAQRTARIVLFNQAGEPVHTSYLVCPACNGDLSLVIDGGDDCIFTCSSGDCPGQDKDGRAQRKRPWWKFWVKQESFQSTVWFPHDLGLGDHF